jgi:DNA-binding beta-propeller fold protein YncE
MQASAKDARADERLFVLDLSGSRVFSLKPDGSEERTLVTECASHPDGIYVDVEAGHIYWTDMGTFDRNDGRIQRVDLDGRNRTVLIAEGATFTPKQLTLDKARGKIYWSDREGMRVMRANLDGSDIETLVERGRGDADRADQTRWCVGIAIDPERGKIYWTQKGPSKGGRGRIFRADMDVPPGQTATNRTDIELLFDQLPEPIDLEIDRKHHLLYWTDRGDPPKGNSVTRVPIEADVKQGNVSEVLLTHLMEGIGISLDVPHDRMFLTDFAGSIYSARLDGSDKRILAQG